MVNVITLNPYPQKREIKRNIPTRYILVIWNEITLLHWHM